jgi:hypothetical protein
MHEESTHYLIIEGYEKRFNNPEKPTSTSIRKKEASDNSMASQFAIYYLLF